MFNQRASLRSILSFALVLSLATASQCIAQTIVYFEDFEADDGNYTATEVIPVAASIVRPWVYNTDGVGGSQGWSTDGGQTGAHPARNPIEMWLTSPDITLSGSGDITLEFDHSFNFEYDAGGDIYWDGGMVMISVNGGAYTQLAGSSFSQNGYNGVMQDDYDWGYAGDFNTQKIFGGSSGGYISSIASLGSFDTGDTISVRFRGGWDWFTIASGANWAIDNVQLSLVAVPEPSTMALGAGIIALLFVGYRKRRSSGKYSR